eukprot:485445-Amphidinium_carterae.1
MGQHIPEHLAHFRQPSFARNPPSAFHLIIPMHADFHCCRGGHGGLEHTRFDHQGLMCRQVVDDTRCVS